MVLRVACSFLARAANPDVVAFLYVGFDKKSLSPLYKTIRCMYDDHADHKQKVLHFTYTT